MKYILLVLCIAMISGAIAADVGVNITSSFSGNATYINYTIYDIPTSYCPASTSTILQGTTLVGCYNQTNVEDSGYKISTEGYTPSGTVYYTGTTFFKKSTSPIYGLSPEFALFIALFIMMFTALMAGTSTAPAIMLCVTFEGWILWSMNMLALLDGTTKSGLPLVPAVLTLMTIFTIVWLFVDYRRKGK